MVPAAAFAGAAGGGGRQPPLPYLAGKLPAPTFVLHAERENARKCGGPVRVCLQSSGACCPDPIPRVCCSRRVACRRTLSGYLMAPAGSVCGASNVSRIRANRFGSLPMQNLIEAGTASNANEVFRTSVMRVCSDPSLQAPICAKMKDRHIGSMGQISPYNPRGGSGRWRQGRRALSARHERRRCLAAEGTAPPSHPRETSAPIHLD
jgi:hypothetical protein